MMMMVMNMTITLMLMDHSWDDRFTVTGARALGLGVSMSCPFPVLKMAGGDEKLLACFIGSPSGVGQAMRACGIQPVAGAHGGALEPQQQVVSLLGSPLQLAEALHRLGFGCRAGPGDGEGLDVADGRADDAGAGDDVPDGAAGGSALQFDISDKLSFSPSWLAAEEVRTSDGAVWPADLLCMAVAPAGADGGDDDGEDADKGADGGILDKFSCSLSGQKAEVSPLPSFSEQWGPAKTPPTGKKKGKRSRTSLAQSCVDGRGNERVTASSGFSERHSDFVLNFAIDGTLRNYGDSLAADQAERLRSELVAAFAGADLSDEAVRMQMGRSIVGFFRQLGDGDDDHG